MSSILNRRWTWKVNVQSGGSGVSSAKVALWDADSSFSSSLTNSSGDIADQSIYEAIYTITDTSTIAETLKTPHTVACLKYGLSPVTLSINFIAARKDTFYMSTDSFITQTDQTTVDAYTGISISHSNKTITLSESHTIEELYDYCQSEAYNNPQKDYPDSIFKTVDGITYQSYYTIILTSGTFNCSNKTINFVSGEKLKCQGGIPDNISIVGDVEWGTSTSLSNFTLDGILQFNDPVTLDLYNSSVDTVTTESGETVIINLSKSTINTNNDPTNITINNFVALVFKVTDMDGNNVPNAAVYLKADSGGALAPGTQIVKTTTDSNGELTVNFNYTSDQPVIGHIRKATSNPYYKTYTLSGTITSSGYNVSAKMVKDE